MDGLVVAVGGGISALTVALTVIGVDWMKVYLECRRQAKLQKALGISVIEYAHQVLKNPKKTSDWLKAPNRRLNGKSPFEIIQTPDGRVRVLDALCRISRGEAA